MIVSVNLNKWLKWLNFGKYLSFELNIHQLKIAEYPFCIVLYCLFLPLNVLKVTLECFTIIMRGRVWLCVGSTFKWSVEERRSKCFIPFHINTSLLGLVSWKMRNTSSVAYGLCVMMVNDWTRMRIDPLCKKCRRPTKSLTGVFRKLADQLELEQKTSSSSLWACFWFCTSTVLLYDCWGGLWFVDLILGWWCEGSACLLVGEFRGSEGGGGVGGS